jgi:tetratricopeptide (TPR) repeat protein
MKKIVGLILAVITLFAGGLLIYSWQSQFTTAEQDFESGKKSFAEAKYDQAAIQLLNAVSKDDHHRDARFTLALALASQGNGPAAVKQLLALLEYYPDDVPAKLQLGTFYLAAGAGNFENFRQAQATAEEILAKDPRNIDALILLSNALAGREDLKSAEEQLRKVLEIAPKNLTAYVNLANLMIKQKRLAEAEKTLLEAKAIEPGNRYVLISLVTLYLSEKKNENADSTLQELLASNPSDRGVYSEVGKTYVRMGRVDVAERIFAEAQKKLPADPMPSIELVDLYAGTNRAAAARRLILELETKFPDSLPVAKKVARVFMELEPDRARKEIDRILKADDRDAEGHLLRGALQWQEKQLEPAKTSLDKALVLNASPAETRFFLGQVAVAQENDTAAEMEFNEALRADPSFVPARVALAELLMRGARWADARVQLQRALDAQPNHFNARRLMAGVDAASGDLANAEKKLVALLQEQPSSALSHNQIGLLYARKGTARAAEEHLQKALELDPESATNARSLVEYYIGQKQAGKGIEVLNATVPDSKKNGLHHELVAQALFNLQRFEDAETALRKSIEKEPNRSSAYTALGQVYLKAGKLDKIPAEMDAVLKIDPKAAFAHVLKGFAFQLLGKSAEARQGYLDALDVDPNNVFAANNLAYLLAQEDSDLTTALKWAQNARRLEPASGEVADTLGWVYHKQGNYVLARDQLRFAANKLPNSEVVWYHLGVATLRSGELQEAATALRRSLGMNRDFKDKPLAQKALKEAEDRLRIRQIP